MGYIWEVNGEGSVGLGEQPQWVRGYLVKNVLSVQGQVRRKWLDLF